jgi:hypothetical protein
VLHNKFMVQYFNKNKGLRLQNNFSDSSSIKINVDNKKMHIKFWLKYTKIEDILG